MYMYVPAPLATADVMRVIGTAGTLGAAARTKTTRESAQSLAIPIFSSILNNGDMDTHDSPWLLEICQSNWGYILMVLDQLLPKMKELNWSRKNK